MNAEQRQAAREACAAATPGPWRWHSWNPEDDPRGFLRRDLPPVPDARTKSGVRTEMATVLDAGGMHTEGFVYCDDADAHFIALARTALPAALDALDERDATIARLLERRLSACAADTYRAIAHFDS